jgi:hypothetical protein
MISGMRSRMSLPKSRRTLKRYAALPALAGPLPIVTSGKLNPPLIRKRPRKNTHVACQQGGRVMRHDIAVVVTWRQEAQDDQNRAGVLLRLAVVDRGRCRFAGSLWCARCLTVGCPGQFVLSSDLDSAVSRDPPAGLVWRIDGPMTRPPEASRTAGCSLWSG